MLFANLLEELSMTVLKQLAFESDAVVMLLQMSALCDSKAVKREEAKELRGWPVAVNAMPQSL